MNLFTRVWANGPSNAYAVGFNGALAHFDGKTWEALAGNTDQPLNCVFGFSSDDVFAVGGDGIILHRPGTDR